MNPLFLWNGLNRNTDTNLKKMFVTLVVITLLILTTPEFKEENEYD